MLTAAVLALALSSQDTVLDLPVYEDARLGISLPRPFEDWVFSPESDRSGTTVIFHPRRASLGDQLWGALIVMTLERPAPLMRVADQRVATAWRPLLGAAYRLLARENAEVGGAAAVRLLMSGTIGRTPLVVEEYVLARGPDLLLLQLRYPRSLPRDSLAAGYARTVEGLRIRPSAEAPAAEEANEPWTVLGGSPWQPRALDALARLDGTNALEMTVRLDLSNGASGSSEDLDVLFPRGSTPLELRVEPGFGVSLVPGRLQRISLGAAVAPGSTVAVTARYRMRPISGGRWLPLVQAPTDSSGEPRDLDRPRATLRFDVPYDLRAVTVGRLVSEAVSEGRRRMTWSVDALSQDGAPFRVGRYSLNQRRVGRLTIRFWGEDRDGSPGPDSLAQEIASDWALLWRGFGPIPVAELTVVFTSEPATTGGAGILFLGADAGTRGVVSRELARTWWGGAISVHGEGATLLLQGLPEWFASGSYGGTLAGTERASALDHARRLTGDARFREALRTTAFEGQRSGVAAARFLDLLSPEGASVLTSLIR